MVTLAEYISELETKLSNSSGLYFTTDMKTKALNEVIMELTQQYDIRDLRVNDDFVFVNGTLPVPDTVNYIDKLWSVSGTGDVLRTYEFTDEDDFDFINPNSYAYWTIAYNPTTEVNDLKIKKSESITLKVRYYKKATTLVNPADESGLTKIWTEGIVYGAISRLMENAKRTDDAQIFKLRQEERLQAPILLTRNQGGIKDYQKFTSVYSERGYLKRR